MILFDRLFRYRQGDKFDGAVSKLPSKALYPPDRQAAVRPSLHPLAARCPFRLPRVEVWSFRLLVARKRLWPPFLEKLHQIKGLAWAGAGHWRLRHPPDRFRQNTNQFLQTSRTVTFIIQKNKASIPGYEAWYADAVLKAWAKDPVMTWAKDARNVIEKEGDLEMFSALRVSVLHSHRLTDDMVLETARHELLKADVDRLLHVAMSSLPPGIADAAVLKIQRRWVANTLPDHELIYAFTYAYAEHYRVCTALADQLGAKLDPTIPHPTDMDPAVNDVAHTRFVKFGKPDTGRMFNKRIKADPNYKPSAAMLSLKAKLDSMPRPDSLATLTLHQKIMAQANFEIHGSHIPMLFLFDKNWETIDCMSTAFSDQSDKYLFWRDMAHRAGYQRAFAMVWRCETWVKDLQQFPEQPMRELPVIGEQLHVVAADATGAVEIVAWNIVRAADGTPPVLELVQPGDRLAPGKQFFIEPVIEAMHAVHAHAMP
jgi:hypothetical protein